MLKETSYSKFIITHKSFTHHKQATKATIQIIRFLISEITFYRIYWSKGNFYIAVLVANLLEQEVRLLKDRQPSMLSSRNKLVMPARRAAIVNTTRQAALTRVSYTDSTLPHLSPKGC